MTATDTNAQTFELSIEHMLKRVRQTTEYELDGYPHFANVDDGQWTTTRDGFWTGGFWPGTLWLAGHYSKNPSFAEHAESWTTRLASRVDSDTVFRGFLFYYAGVVGAELGDSDAAADLAIRAARSLRQTFNAEAGVMPLGSEAEEAHTVSESDANVDSLSASLLLAWAAKRTGDDDLKQVAVRHALKIADFCIRDDGSVCQSATFGAKSGKVLRTFTHKGYSDRSTWTRAQAWAMLGYAYLANVAPEEPRLLRLAETVSDWWIAHVPTDHIAFWDFDAPAESDPPKDTSGTAIAAAALLKLAAAHNDENAADKYYCHSKRAVGTLCDKYLTPTHGDDARHPGILTAGCFDPKRGVAIKNELIWGDYFLLEALGVIEGLLPKETVQI